MATVILPMGYPLQSGQEYEHIIYQGSVVRSYTLPKDPRSATQIQNRRFLSDFGKMRSMAGDYARAACRSGLGTKWGTIVYQYAKADIDFCWSDAVSEWESFTEPGREEWRAIAPYEATFNDKGLIFFCLLRVVYYTLNDQAFDLFGCEAWGEFESAAALDWWTKDLSELPSKGDLDSIALAMFHGVVGTVVSNASAWAGSYLEDVSTFELYIYGFNVQFFGRRAPGLGTIKRWFDGVPSAEFNISNASEIFQTSLGSAGSNGLDGRNFKGLHKIKFEVVSGSVNIDKVQVN